MPQVRAAWIERFASRLIELQPESTPLDAVRFASSAFQELPHLEPDKAAEVCALGSARSDSPGENC